MTRLLEQGIEAIRLLPEDRQDVAGELLLAVAGAAHRKYSLTNEQIEDVNQALVEADRGDFATDEEMQAFWADSVR